MNDFASFVLWLMVAILILHIIQGDAVDWVKTKFSAKDTASSNPSNSSVVGLITATNPNANGPTDNNGNVIDNAHPGKIGGPGQHPL